MSNRPWVICTIAFGLSFVILASFLSFAVYYARVVLGKDATYGGLLLTTFTVCGLAGNVSVSMPWMDWLGAPKRRLQVSYAVLAASLVIIGISPANSAVFLPCYIVACFACGFGSPVYYAMLADSIDYGSRITGVRSAGMGYSLNSLAQKALFGLTSALLAQFLTFGGYVPDAPHQNASLAAWVTAGFIWLPASVSLVLIAVVGLYPSSSYGLRTGDAEASRLVGQEGT
jgi:Na+/melibiose symporter-like transporter